MLHTWMSQHFFKPDSTLTVHNIMKAVAGVNLQILGAYLRIPVSKLTEALEDYPTPEQKGGAILCYWLQYVPNASWTTLAGTLYYMKENAALGRVMVNFQRQLGTHVVSKPQ